MFKVTAFYMQQTKHFGQKLRVKIGADDEADQAFV